MLSALGEAQASIVLAVVDEIQPDEHDVAVDLLNSSRGGMFGRRGAVGHGAQFDLTTITPFVTLFVVWVSGVVVGETKAQLEKRIRKLIRRLFKITEIAFPIDSEGTGDANLDWEKLESDVSTWGKALGLKAAKAEILAELVVGRVRSGE